MNEKPGKKWLAGAPQVHLRRCHRCDGVTEKLDAIVNRCGHCGKSMAPFFFFDEVLVLPYSEAELRPQSLIEEGTRLPIRGLTAFW